jgi:hypothetical protein
MPSMFYIFQHRKKLANELQKRKHENVDCPHDCFFHIEGRTREGGGTSPQWTTAARPSSAGYTAELEPGHSGRTKPAKATELQAPCVTVLL